MIIATGYTGLWFMQAYRIENAFYKALEELNKSAKYIKISVGAVRISGFPLGYHITIGNAQATLVIPEKKIRYQVSHMEPLMFSTGFLGNRLHLQLPGRLDVVRYNGDSVTGSFAAVYKKKPEITLRLTTDYSNVLFMKGLPDMSALMRQFKEISYQDKGMSLVESKTGEAAATYDDYTVILTQSSLEGGKSVFHFRASGNNIVMNREEWLDGMEPYIQEILKDAVDASQDTGAYDFNIEFALSGHFPPRRRSDLEFSLDIKQAAYVNALYAWNSDGKITAAKDDILPYGWCRVNIKNYKDFLKQVFAVVNTGIRLAKGGDPLQYPDLQEINEQDKKALFDTLKAVGTFSSDEKDISIVIAREKGGEVYIGQLPIEEAMVFIQGGV